MTNQCDLNAGTVDQTGACGVFCSPYTMAEIEAAGKAGRKAAKEEIEEIMDTYNLDVYDAAAALRLYSVMHSLQGRRFRVEYEHEKDGYWEEGDLDPGDEEWAVYVDDVLIAEGERMDSVMDEAARRLNRT